LTVLAILTFSSDYISRGSFLPEKIYISRFQADIIIPSLPHCHPALSWSPPPQSPTLRRPFGYSMEVFAGGSPWDGVVELTKAAQEKGTDPLSWAMQIQTHLNSAGESLPSVELADVLVSHIFWENNVPILWKFLEKALSLNIVPPMLVLALLSVRFVLYFPSFPVF